MPDLHTALPDFIRARLAEAPNELADWKLGIEGVLDEHKPTDGSTGEHWERTPDGDVVTYHVPGPACAGCNASFDEEYANTINECPTMRALARIWRKHDGWREDWTGGARTHVRTVGGSPATGIPARTYMPVVDPSDGTVDYIDVTTYGG